MSEEASDGWTRAAMVVGGVARREDAILLVHERTLGGEVPDQWVLPGGRVEPGELLDAAVKREVEGRSGHRTTHPDGANRFCIWPSTSNWTRAPRIGLSPTIPTA